MFFTVLIALVFASLSVSAFIYPGFVESYFHINTQFFLATSLVFVLVSAANKQHRPGQKLIKINQIIFPTLLFLFIFLSYLEYSNYANFVYSTFHVDLVSLGNLTIFAGVTVYAFLRDYSRQRPFYYLFLPISLVFFWVVLLKNSDLFTLLVKEDGPAEYLQFLLYLASSVFALRVFFHFQKLPGSKMFAYAFLVLAIAFTFVAVEEISWGQRIIGIETPDAIKEINFQNETTFHNLNSIDKYLHPTYIVLGFYGAFSYFFVTKILPGSFGKLTVFAPPPVFTFCFLSISVFYLLFDYYLFPRGITVYEHINIIRWQEVFETYLAFGFFGYITYVFGNRSALTKRGVRESIKMVKGSNVAFVEKKYKMRGY